MGMTMAEKVLARAGWKAQVKPGEYVTAKIDQVMHVGEVTHGSTVKKWQTLSTHGLYYFKEEEIPVV